jgi:hypothetical protein
MFNLFKKKKEINNQIEVTVSGVNPQNENEFLFYNFVQYEFSSHLEKWFHQAKSNGIVFKPQYEQAIRQKIKMDDFRNPHSFPEYFGNKFDL